MLSARINPSQPLSRRRPRALALLPAFFALALAPCAAFQHNQMPRAQRHESHREIFQLEEAWRVAVLKADIPALDAMLADDYTAVTASGTLQSKEQALANLRSGATHFTSLVISDHRVRFYGTVALVNSRAEVHATTAAGDISGSYRYTRVYVRNEQGQWKIVSFEASRIREGAERK
jgi:ketosteroid isomerase-like protein